MLLYLEKVFSSDLKRADALATPITMSILGVRQARMPEKEIRTYTFDTKQVGMLRVVIMYFLVIKPASMKPETTSYISKTLAVPLLSSTATSRLIMFLSQLIYSPTISIHHTPQSAVMLNSARQLLLQHQQPVSYSMIPQTSYTTTMVLTG